MSKSKLLPDPEKKNGRHAKSAHAALRHYRSVTGNDRETALGDLLADLMHWSDRNNFDFDLALSRAQAHYDAETDTLPKPSRLHSTSHKTVDIASRTKGARSPDVAKMEAALKAVATELDEATDILHYEDGQPVTALEGWQIERIFDGLRSVMVQVDEALPKPVCARLGSRLASWTAAPTPQE